MVLMGCYWVCTDNKQCHIGILPSIQLKLIKILERKEDMDSNSQRYQTFVFLIIAFPLFSNHFIGESLDLFKVRILS
uniref:Uncharacterized protein n=1 Tax=Anguilla anguilla TaxID=7936 RepID=A0A0E9X7G8_ANGAN